MAFNLPQISFADYTQQLYSNDLVLTRNNRQARFLEQTWAQNCQGGALTDIPKILPIQAWLEQSWQRLSTDKIISQAESLCCIIESLQQDEIPDAMDTDTLAKHILAGYHLLSQWQLPLSALETLVYEPTTALFLKHAQAFADMLENNRLITSQDIANQIIPFLTDMPLESVYLYGFVDINPSLENLFIELDQLCSIYLVNPQPMISQVEAKCFSHRQEEYAAMAAWAFQYHQEHPTAQIVCVVPDLTQSHIDCLDAFLKADTNALEKINISSGDPLNQTQLVNSALTLLNLNTYQTPLDHLLSCVHIGLWFRDDIKTQIAKDRLCTQLMNTGSRNSHLKQWLQNLNAENPLSAQLIELLTQWCETKLAKPKGKQNFQTWLNHFCQEWQAIGWPGQQALSSLHYQQYQHFQQVWLDFLQLDTILQPCTHKQALNYFNKLCKQRLFAPESKNRPINILGALEAHGINADALWICHMDNHTWPPRGRVNPLLPYSLQKQYKMPNACHIYTKNYYQTITADILQSAKHTQISYAQWHEHLEQSPSPFFVEYIFENTKFTYPEKENLSNHEFTSIDDLTGPPLKSKKIPGGSYGIQAQAQCPFQYFTHYRLGLAETHLPAMGFEAFERGNLVHEALAYFYQHIDSSQTLKHLQPPQRAQLIENAIEHSIKDFSKSDLFLTVEKERLTLLLNQWLDFECKRPDFTIESIEQVTQFSINDFNLSMRLDRVDRLDDQSLLVMDYKTSQQASTQGWYDDRLTNPQVPLYVLSLGKSCQSVALALVKRGDPKFVGLSKNQTDIKGIRSTHKDEDYWQWPALTEKWQQQVSNLTDEIKKGYAAVMPDNNSKPCQYCDMYLVCRIHHD